MTIDNRMILNLYITHAMFILASGTWRDENRGVFYNYRQIHAFLVLHNRMNMTMSHA